MADDDINDLSPWEKINRYDTAKNIQLTIYGSAIGFMYSLSVDNSIKCLQDTGHKCAYIFSYNNIISSIAIFTMHSLMLLLYTTLGFACHYTRMFNGMKRGFIFVIAFIFQSGVLGFQNIDIFGTYYPFMILSIFISWLLMSIFIEHKFQGVS